MRFFRFLACCGVFACMAYPAVANDLGHDDWEWRGQPEAPDASRALALQGPAWLQMVTWQTAAAGGSDVAAGSGAARPSSQPSTDSDLVQERWSDFLPLWGKTLREQGYKLPLPFGVSIMGAGLWQDTLQENLKLSFDPGSPPIDTGLIELSPADTVDGSIGVRLDAFLLPFLDVYAMGGFNTGEAEFELTIAPNTVLPEGAQFTVQEDYIGGWVGGGATVALGWKQLFWMADGNGTWSKVNSADSVIVAATFSTRAGWRGEFEKAAWTAWVGTMYLHYTQTVETSVPVLGLNLELDIAGADPWNMLLGTQVDIGRNWTLMVEGGFIGRKQIVANASFRF